MSMTISAVSSQAHPPPQMARRMALSPIVAVNAAVLPAPDFRRFNLHYAVFPPQLYVQLRDPDTGEVTFQAPNEADVKRVQATRPVRSPLPEAPMGEPSVRAEAPPAPSPPATLSVRGDKVAAARGDSVNTSA